MIQIHIPTYDQIDEIVALNSKYLIANLSAVQQQNGFIRIRYNKDDIKTLITHKEIVVATEYNKVIGYYLVANKLEKSIHDSHRILVEDLSVDLMTSVEKFGIGLQVVMDLNYRIFFTFKSMANFLFNQVNNKYNFLLGFISKSNISSTRIHEIIGFRKINKMDDTVGNYYIIKI